MLYHGNVDAVCGLFIDSTDRSTDIFGESGSAIDAERTGNCAKATETK